MQRQGYFTDLHDDQWDELSPWLDIRAPTGRPAKYSLRHVVDALSFMVSTGCQWRNIPHDFPPWRTVHYYFTKWKESGILTTIEQALLRAIRQREGRQPEPTAGIIDAQAVDCPTSGEERGYDSNKNVKGRKRHLLTDVLGLVVCMSITSAELHDRYGVRLLLNSASFPKSITHIWADKGYRGPIVAEVARQQKVTFEIVANPKPHSFVIAKRRWVVERTHAWLSGARRLTVDREKTVASSMAMLNLRLCLPYSRWSCHGIA
jgi:transposase